MRLACFAVYIAVGLGAVLVAAEPANPEATKPGGPAPETVVAAMKKAAARMRSDVAFAGGYAWKWPTDLSNAQGEDRSSPTLIVMQPPGTPAIGQVMLQAYAASGDRLFLQAAKEAAQALIWCQLATGGWDSDFDFDPRKARNYHFRRDLEAGDSDPGKRRGASSLDDRKTQAPLLFLLELSHTEGAKNDPAVRAALKFGLDGLLAAQAPNGGWPQHYRGSADPSAPVSQARIPAQWSRVWPAVNYSGFYTLNDGNIFWVVKLLLRAHVLEQDERYLAAAKRAGEFLLRARLPEPQPVWAQQYNQDMEPVWARKFEPPAVSSAESLGALKTLFELWLATGDPRWVEPFEAARTWFAKTKLPDGRWARFYELGTNTPLYTKAETYELTYDDSDLPSHYGFKIDADLQEDLDDLVSSIKEGREAVLQDRAEPDSPKRWASRARGQVSKVQIALKEQDSKGWWLKNGLIDAGSFVKQMTAMSAYVTAAKNAGSAFEASRGKEPVEPSGKAH